MKKRFKRKRGLVRAKKVIYDGITFASGLEKYMYMSLRKAKIKAAYEGMTYEIFPGFMFDNESYERQANGKGDLATSHLIKEAVALTKWKASKLLPKYNDNVKKLELANHDNQPLVVKWSDK